MSAVARPDPSGGHGDAGVLVLVGTPIGNLADLSPRAVHALTRADVVCCEDTRRTRALLTSAGVRGKTLLSVHAHNEAQRAAEVVARLVAGAEVALVSDAGIPTVSDPGARLVAAVAAAGIRVTVVPGPSAVVGALAVSGLPADRFCFEGFLPRRGTERRRRLAAVAGAGATTVLFEAPGRVAATLADLAQACGPDRAAVVVRELTKVHEEVWRGTTGAAAAEFASRETKGEVVIVVGPAPAAPSVPDDAAVARALDRRLAAGESLRDASSQVAEELGVARRVAYRVGLSLERNPMT